MQVNQNSIANMNWSYALNETLSLAKTTASGWALGKLIGTKTDPRALLIGLVASKILGKATSKARLPVGQIIQHNEKEIARKEASGKKIVFADKAISIGAAGGFIGAIIANPYLSAAASNYAGFEILGFEIAGAHLLRALTEVAINIIYPGPDNLFDNSSVVNITQENFHKEVEESDIPVVLDAYATWCPPCKMLAPLFASLSNEMPLVKFAKVNVSEQKDLAKQLNISAMPTLLLYKDGTVVDTQTGFLEKEPLRALLEEKFELPKVQLCDVSQLAQEEALAV